MGWRPIPRVLGHLGRSLQGRRGGVFGRAGVSGLDSGPDSGVDTRELHERGRSLTRSLGRRLRGHQGGDSSLPAASCLILHVHLHGVHMGDAGART